MGDQLARLRHSCSERPSHQKVPRGSKFKRAMSGNAKQKGVNSNREGGAIPCANTVGYSHELRDLAFIP